MVRTRTWIWGILLVFLLSAAVVWFLAVRKPEGTTANIYLDGVCVESMDLSAVEESRSFLVEGPAGSNRITVEPGRICVSEADCPDQVCVHQGWISNSALPIVCLPNRLVIRIEANASSPASFDSAIK